MKTKTIVVALTTLLIGSLCFWACQKDEGLPVKPDVAEIMDLKAGPAQPVMVPFKGKGTWQVVGFEPVVEDNVMMVFVELEGTATHLGRFQCEMTAHFELLYLGDDEDGNPIYYKTDYLSHSGRFTAANGDELYDEGCVDEHGTVNVPDDFFGFFMTGVQLVGGTGRFENAEETYDWLVIATVPPDPFPAGTWELEGRISRPGR